MTATSGNVSQTASFTKTKVNVGIFTPPANHIPLTNNQWMNGSIGTYGDHVWYSFNVTAGTTYRIWWNDLYDGDGSKTLDVLVSAFNDGKIIFANNDDGWYYPKEFTASSNGIVYLRVSAYYYDETGTFAIVYSTGTTRP